VVGGLAVGDVESRRVGRPRGPNDDPWIEFAPNVGGHENESEQLSESANREHGTVASEACVRAHGECDRGFELHYAVWGRDDLTRTDVEAHPTRRRVGLMRSVHYECISYGEQSFICFGLEKRPRRFEQTLTV